MLNAENARKTLKESLGKKQKESREAQAKHDLHDIEVGLQKAIENDENEIYIELSEERMNAIQPALEKLGFKISPKEKTAVPLSIIFKKFVIITSLIELRNDLKLYLISFDL